jgi:hypothetical protein
LQSRYRQGRRYSLCETVEIAPAGSALMQSFAAFLDARRAKSRKAWCGTVPAELRAEHDGAPLAERLEAACDDFVDHGGWPRAEKLKRALADGRAFLKARGK